jgi:hypothetical protein
MPSFFTAYMLVIATLAVVLAGVAINRSLRGGEEQSFSRLERRLKLLQLLKQLDKPDM